MTGNAGKLHLAVLLTALPLIVIGCAPPPLPSPEEILMGLSQAILQAEMTCAELREDFGLDSLPLVDTPDEVGIDFEEHKVRATNGEMLRVWYMPASAPRGTVVVSPGNSGPMSCYLFTARLLTEDGWSVVMYDYQGFGGSSGEPALQSMRADLETVVDWARAQTGNEQVTLVGMSLGTIPSVAVAVERPEAVNAVVLDSPVAMGVEIERFGFLVHGRSEEVTAVLDPWLVTEDIIDQMRQPLLVFMHELDIVTPARAVELLFERAGGPKDIVCFAGLEHAAGQFERTDEYRAHLETFLDEIWR